MILVLLPTLALLGIGVFLVIGTLKGVGFLTQTPKGWFYFYPYWFLRKFFGERAVYYFHIFIGIVFIFGAVGLFAYVLMNL